MTLTDMFEKKPKRLSSAIDVDKSGINNSSSSDCGESSKENVQPPKKIKLDCNGSSATKVSFVIL